MIILVQEKYEGHSFRISQQSSNLNILALKKPAYMILIFSSLLQAGDSNHISLPQTFLSLIFQSCSMTFLDEDSVWVGKKTNI